MLSIYLNLFTLYAERMLPPLQLGSQPPAIMYQSIASYARKLNIIISQACICHLFSKGSIEIVKQILCTRRSELMRLR